MLNHKYSTFVINPSIFLRGGHSINYKQRILVKWNSLTVKDNELKKKKEEQI